MSSWRRDSDRLWHDAVERHFCNPFWRSPGFDWAQWAPYPAQGRDLGLKRSAVCCKGHPGKCRQRGFFRQADLVVSQQEKTSRIAGWKAVLRYLVQSVTLCQDLAL